MPATPTKPGKFPCCRCGEPCEKAEYYLLRNGGHNADWCGTLWGSCQSCSGIETKTEFLKAADTAWKVRSRELHGKKERVRDILYRGERAAQEHLEGTISNTKIRKKVLDNIRMAVMVLAAAFDKSSPDVQKYIKKTTAEYLRDVHQQATDPTHVPSVEGRVLTAKDISFFTEVCEGFAVSYLCRACLFYGMNNQWIASNMSYHFACPACGLWYRPAVSREGLIDAQKCVVLVDPATQEVVTFAAKWPISVDDSWLNKMVETRAAELAVEKGTLVSEGITSVEQYLTGTAKHISKLLAAVKIPQGFRHFDFNRAAVTEKLAPRFSASTQWEQHVQQGYWGNYLPQSAKQDSVFENWDALITLFAKGVVGTRAMAELSRM